jgi:hypothetical protein
MTRIGASECPLESLFGSSVGPLGKTDLSIQTDCVCGKSVVITSVHSNRCWRMWFAMKWSHLWGVGIKGGFPLFSRIALLLGKTDLLIQTDCVYGKTAVIASVHSNRCWRMWFAMKWSHLWGVGIKGGFPLFFRIALLLGKTDLYWFRQIASTEKAQ